ncbi:MAG: hypothetical protein FWC64_11210 [Treponema sp.]|nr:hypothetical protein [Treponema sp.]
MKPKCLHCGSQKYQLNGTKGGVQRYRCKDCKRYFSDKPRKFTFGDKERAVEMYLNNCGVRKTARFMNCSPYMILLWVKEFAKYAKTADHSQNGDVVEMDEIFTKVKKKKTGS